MAASNTIMTAFGSFSGRHWAGLSDGPNYLLIEFENVASPGDTVAPPSVDPDDGVDYYTGLSSPRDYVRAAVLHKSLDADGNAVFTAWVSSDVGENGLPFTAAANSKIFGVALAYGPDAGDPSQDEILARSYFADAAQFVRGVSDVSAAYTLETVA